MKHAALVWTFFFASPALSAETGIQRVRLTETSVTETGRFTGDASVKLITRGYGFSYIAPCGFGAAYTLLRTNGERDDVAIDLKHNYVDLTYTYGDRWRISGGFGVGVSGTGTAGTDPRSRLWRELV